MLGIHLRNWLRYIAIPLCILLLLGSCPYTRPFTDASGRAIPAGLAQMEMLQIGGVKQSVWFRGRDTAAPALQCRIGRLFSGCLLGATRSREVVSWKHRSRIDDYRTNRAGS
ncbi:hypothetical protein NMYAN_10165 [Nitrosomonas nitrosa]|uniref:Uncharacterized protein n=1 Tax=Nitrosomonas nitrosa TaxID=52442 RepID=A0A8H8YWX9_9PROT|nr:hypothetical protein NMYAN_10165 [Nitrosomonas nitrosa]